MARVVLELERLDRGQELRAQIDALEVMTEDPFFGGPLRAQNRTLYLRLAEECFQKWRLLPYRLVPSFRHQNLLFHDGLIE